MSEPLSESLERLQFHLDNQSGFWFALVAADAESPRARMREVTEAWCKATGVPFFFHALDPLALVPLGIELSRGGKPGIHWIRADGVKGTSAEWDKQATLLFMAMNERRDAYRKRHEGAIIVEGRASLKPLLRDLAPDLFSIRAFIAEPSEEEREVERFEAPEGQRVTPSIDENDSIKGDLETLLQRIARLEGETAPDAVHTRISLRFQAADVLLRREQLKEARELVDALQYELAASPGLQSWVQDRANVLICHVLTLQAAADLDWQRALDHANRMMDIVERHPESWDAGYRGGLYETRSLVHRGVKALDNARLDGRKAIQCVEDALAAKPDEPELRKRFLDWSAQNAIWLASYEEGRAESLEVAMKASAFVERWRSERPHEIRWLYEQCELEQTIALVLLLSGDLKGVLRASRQALRLAELCAQRDPGDVYVHRSKVSSLLLSSLGHVIDGDLSSEALRVYAQTLMDLSVELRNDTSDVPLIGVIHACVEIVNAVLLGIRGEGRRAAEALLHAANRVERISRRLVRRRLFAGLVFVGKLLDRT